VIVAIVAIILLLIYGLCKCARKRAAAQDCASEPGDLEAQAATSFRPPDNSATDYPQFTSLITYTIDSSGVVHVPSTSVFDGYSPARKPFTRAQIEAMSEDELKTLKQKLNMG